MVLWIGAILTLIKSVFTEYGYDSSYHIALSWRHINGDRMFMEMWEPHQTSAFLMDLLLIMYRHLVPSMTGIALFLQIIGAVIYSTVVIFLYRAFCLCFDRKTSSLIALILMVARPKGVTMIEFSNAIMMFSFLIVTSLIYLVIRERMVFCLMATLFTCLLVVVYPSTVIVFIFVLIFLFGMNRKYAWVYLSICALAGLCYLGYFTFKIGLNDFLYGVLHIVSGDSTHGAGDTFRLFQTDFDIAYFSNVLFPMLLIVGFALRRKMDPDELIIWKICSAISISTFLAVMLLTNQSIYTVFGYMTVGAAVSFVPISKVCRKHGGVILSLICIIFILIRGFYVMNGYSALNGRSILKAENIIREGPAIGIVAPLSTVNEMRDSIKDFDVAVMDEDSVLAVSEWMIDSIVYLYTDASIANYSTIDTTTYSDQLDEYWSMYPDKTPTVIAFKSYLGEKVPEEWSYIGNLIDEGYELSYVGKQWIFYRMKK